MRDSDRLLARKLNPESTDRNRLTLSQDLAKRTAPLSFEIVDIVSPGLFSCLIEIYFDGLCQPTNPGGIACYAFIVRKDGKVVHSDYGIAAEPYSKDSTNNVAEYTAFIKALEWATNHSRVDEQIKVSSDSRLVVSQLNGDYKVKSKRIVPLYKRASALKKIFPGLEIRWIPREENREADALTNKAYRESLRRHPQKSSTLRRVI